MRKDLNLGEKETTDLSRAQLYLIGGSIAAIVVLSFLLVHLFKKTPQEPAQIQTAAVQQPATTDGKQAGAQGVESKDEIGKLEQSLPKQVQQPAKDGEKNQKPAEKKITENSTPQPKAAPQTDKTPAPKKQAAAVAGAPVKTDEGTRAVPAKELGVNKNTPASHVNNVKPPVKSAKAIHRIKTKPLNKQVDVKAKKSRTSEEKVAAKKETPVKPSETSAKSEEKTAKIAAPAPAPAEKLSKTPDKNAFVNEPVAPAPTPVTPVTATPEDTAKTAPTTPKQNEKPKTPEETSKTAPNAPQQNEKPKTPDEAAKTAPTAPLQNEKPKAPAEENPEFTFMVKSYPTNAEADDFAKVLAQKGWKTRVLKKKTVKSVWYQVLVGGYPDRETAQKAASEFKEKEGLKAIVQRY
ncbi:MAG: SPOR domain-containing protein [Nitrospinae bacterium]|nr:SPOR domain-containing protein [Nitrospinota bacterium]